jgi:hypothetical protein
MVMRQELDPWRPTPHQQLPNVNENRIWESVTSQEEDQTAPIVLGLSKNEDYASLPPKTDTAAGPFSEKETEKSRLLKQLNRLRRKRRQLEQKSLPALEHYLNEWNFRVSCTQKFHQFTLSKLEAVVRRKRWTEEEYQFTLKWQVLSDVFLIWHRGPFGTINSLRVGKSASTTLGLVEKCGSSRTEGQLRIGGESYLNSGNNLSENHTVSRGTNANAMQKQITVPWNEINSALGQILFLLNTLQNAPHSGIFFHDHVLQPCGSASKIGIIKQQAAGDAPHAVTWYNLHHYDENGSILSMGYYARRNFNIALEGLLHCIAQASLVVEKRDMALGGPIIMRINGLVVGKGRSNKGVDRPNDGIATLGGLPFAYDPSTGEQWTKVCKFLMINLNWLVAYAAKHVGT